MSYADRLERITFCLDALLLALDGDDLPGPSTWSELPLDHSGSIPPDHPGKNATLALSVTMTEYAVVRLLRMVSHLYERHTPR